MSLLRKHNRCDNFYLKFARCKPGRNRCSSGFVCSGSCTDHFSRETQPRDTTPPDRDRPPFRPNLRSACRCSVNAHEIRSIREKKATSKETIDYYTGKTTHRTFRAFDKATVTLVAIFKDRLQEDRVRRIFLARADRHAQIVILRWINSVDKSNECECTCREDKCWIYCCWCGQIRELCVIDVEHSLLL